VITHISLRLSGLNGILIIREIIYPNRKKILLTTDTMNARRSKKYNSQKKMAVLSDDHGKKKCQCLIKLIKKKIFLCKNVNKSVYSFVNGFNLNCSNLDVVVMSV
jgi:hypothetical protein